MKSLEQLDRWIAGRVKSWASRVAGTPATPELLEIRREILDDVRDRIEPLGEGRSVFAYNRIAVRLAAPTGGDRELYQAAFEGEDGLEQDIRALLKAANASVPAGFSVSVEAADDPALAFAARPFRLEYGHRKAAVEARGVKRPPARLIVISGQAEPAEFPIASDRVNIGRLKEVIAAKGGLKRRNDVAFADSETTVSREHASIRYDPDEGKFRLYDSNSQRGTTVFRDGRRIEVPRGAALGITLHSGDEVHVGEARIRFEIVPENGF